MNNFQLQNLSPSSLSLLSDSVTEMEIVNGTVASLVMELAPENVSLYGNGTIEKILESLEVMPDPQVKLAHDILICVLLVSVMFAMGCHITVSEVSK